MDIYVCGGKQQQGSKTIYLLRNVRNNKETVVEGNQLKDALRSKRVDVMNLTLTSDNRLIEASKDKIAQLSGLLNAPYGLREYLDPLNPEYMNNVEDIMDEIIKDSIEAYVKDCKKYVKICNVNKENNTFVLEFTLGLNSYVMCHYDKIIYGEINEKAGKPTRNVYGHPTSGSNYRDEIGAICFDIGIQVLSISNKRASSKIGSGKIFKASESINTLLYRDGEAIRLNYKTDNSCKLNWDDKDIERLKEKLGQFILNNIANELIQVCNNNPDIANNTRISDYIKYDNMQKEYIKCVSAFTAIGLGGAVVLTAVIALSIGLNPDILSTGLLAKIANVGTTEQIFNTILGLAGGTGGVLGTGISAMALKDSGAFEMIKETKEEKNELRDKKKSDWMSFLGKR